MGSIFQETITNLNVHVPNKRASKYVLLRNNTYIDYINLKDKIFSFHSCIHPWTSAVIKIVQCIFIILKPFSEGAVHTEVEQQLWKWLFVPYLLGQESAMTSHSALLESPHQRVLMEEHIVGWRRLVQSLPTPGTAPLQLLGQSS